MGVGMRPPDYSLDYLHMTLTCKSFGTLVGRGYKTQLQHGGLSVGRLVARLSWPAMFPYLTSDPSIGRFNTLVRVTCLLAMVGYPC